MHKPVFSLPGFPHWMNDLMQLVARFPEQNVDADLGAMTEAELWGLYLRLRRLANP
jgi:predicted Zn-dependent protease with MMP-like domain